MRSTECRGTGVASWAYDGSVRSAAIVFVLPDCAAAPARPAVAPPRGLLAREASRDPWHAGDGGDRSLVDAAREAVNECRASN